MICLSGWARRKYCCVYTHKKCQKRWGSSCIICKKNTGIFTRNSYVFIPDNEVPELSQEEIAEQLDIMRQINFQAALIIELNRLAELNTPEN